VSQDARGPSALSRWAGRWMLELFAAYIVLSLAALIALRAELKTLDFLGVGWIILLVGLPLLPWVLPRLGGFLKAISPYVQSFSLGGVQLQLRAVQEKPLAVPTQGIFASLPNDQGGLSSSTAINAIVESLRALLKAAGAPVAIIDLQAGAKWRLPNLYFLCFLLEVEPVVTELIFTEMRGGIDGYAVLTTTPGQLRQRVEQALPAYRKASDDLHLNERLQSGRVLDLNYAGELGLAFQALLNALSPAPPMPPVPADDDVLLGYVSAARLAQVMGTTSHLVALEAPSGTLTEADLRTALDAEYRFVPSTSDGRLVGIIDRDVVALTVARAAVASR
jgi:hypothetical protein